ncbi:NAD(P)H-dependent flavin oxidoreductase [Phytohabitans suffuscus]|uniref:2-nitropropane dioxygenase n=1 Tax=Phytohabitans suffuscus TaxID=624315 RepID=A0A6F8YCE3_9ACTN|nr:nitronate monooxygenase [Phytohabitans suffuscus]BCB83772.1 2-nitropropane dioxygenase [Phytohabitans suffuscus]
MPDSLRQRLRLPVICAPMFLVTGPDLVTAACRNGLVGALPRQNARGIEEFDAWLTRIRRDLDAHRERHPDAAIGPIAVNISRAVMATHLAEHLEVCRRHGVELIISAQGDPTELTKRVHDWGGTVFHDVTSIRFAEKAITAGVDGLTCIGAGGGGHSGLVSHLTLVPRVREMFDGTIVLAGAVASGAAVRAAEILGADLAYIGTRFIATRESSAPQAYKEMLVEASAADLLYTGAVAAVPANWLVPSLRHAGLDTTNLPAPTRRGDYSHLPEDVRPWRDIWSAGQGVELITDIPSVDELVRRLVTEYRAACATPTWPVGADAPVRETEQDGGDGS